MKPISKNIVLVVSLSLLLISAPRLLWADWVRVTGSAPLKDGRYEVARKYAREDALQQAIMQFGTKVKSHQKVENGILKQDQVSISSEARVNKSMVEEEYVWKDVLYLSLNVDVEAVPSCGNSQASAYKKKVAVLGFSMQSPEQARMGAIQNVERGFASALNLVLHEQQNLVVFENSHIALHGETMNAPSHYTEQNTLTKAADFAKQMGTQFVISGVIRDMGVEDQAAFSNSYWSKLKRLGSKANQNRRFTTELFVHDGFSGAIVWQKTFSISAEWNADAQHKLGFGSAEFWELEYGKAVGRLIGDMGGMVNEQLRCQPFMTRISRIDGKTLHFSSGASSGVRPGDKLSLYRTFNYYDADMLKGMELTNVKTALTVSQVHPGFSSGRISVDSGRLNIQEDDLLIAW